MTEINKTIFDNFQVRKTSRQKTAFIDFATDKISSLGYDVRVEKASFGSRNIVVGDVESAKVVYTAHYDTQPVLPFPNFITPRCFPIYLIYQIVLTLFILFVPAAVGFAIGVPTYLLLKALCVPAEILDIVIHIVSCALVIAALLIVMFGPANKHTANDNTSGVCTLFEIMEKLPAQMRYRAAFVFFDNEELGLIGSSSFASKHKNTMKNKLLINFDCVSDGDNMLFAVKPKAKKYIPYLEKAYETREGFSVGIYSKGVIYPSDQASFAMGVGACALKKSKKFNILYMDRIHTPRDTVYNEENVRFFADGSVKLLSVLHSDNAEINSEIQS